jgi:hypothetical protein
MLRNPILIALYIFRLKLIYVIMYVSDIIIWTVLIMDVYDTFEIIIFVRKKYCCDDCVMLLTPVLASCGVQERRKE